MRTDVGAAALEVAGVTAGYGRVVAIDGVSIAAPPRSVTCVLGRNGAGKTTLAKTIAGLLRPTAGTIALAGTDVTAASAMARARAGVFYVAQDKGVFPGLSTREHLRLVDRGAGASQAEVLARFPSLEARLDTDAARLSGGERKMLQLSMALLAGPSVLVLDEPTEGVAPIIVQELQDAIVRIAERTAVVLVEQNLHTIVAVGDRGYVMDTGRVVGELDEREIRDADVVKGWVQL